MKRSFCMLLATLVMATIGDADDISLDEMIVVASRHETALIDAPYQVYALEADDLQLRLQPRSLSEALKAAPGVLLQKTGHGMTSPFLRGVTSQRIVLVADGIRMNNSYLREGPNQYWNQIDGFFYDRLEVLLGPASVLYGSDAIGGVVHAQSAPLERGTGDGLQWLGGHGVVRYSSAEHSHTEHLQGDVAIGERLTLRLGVTSQQFGELRSGDGETNADSNFEQLGGNFRLQYWFDDDNRLIIGSDVFDQDDIGRIHRTVNHVDFHGTSSKGGTSDRARIFDHDRRTLFARYEHRNGEGFIEEFDLGLSYSYFTELFRRERGSGDQQLRKARIQTIGLTLRLQSSNDWGIWTYGLDYHHDIADTWGTNYTAATDTYTQRIQGLVGDNSDYDLLGVYLQNEKALSERLELTTGVRATYARLSADDVRFQSAQGDVSERVAGDWNAITSSIRLLWRVGDADELNFYAGASQGFRAPNLSDATRDGEFGGGVEVPTAGLDPEYFTTVELGAKGHSERAQWSAVGYHTFIEDRIGRLSGGGKRNLDNGFIHGIEANLSLKLSDQLTAFGFIAWQEGREDHFLDRNPANPTEDHPMSRMLPLTGRIGLRWDASDGDWWLEALSEMADDQDKYTDAEENDNRFPPNGTPGYAVFHVRGGMKLGEQTNLVVALENIGDRAYRVHGSGINEPGRNLVMTLRRSF